MAPQVLLPRVAPGAPESPTPQSDAVAASIQQSTEANSPESEMAGFHDTICNCNNPETHATYASPMCDKLGGEDKYQHYHGLNEGSEHVCVTSSAHKPGDAFTNANCAAAYGPNFNAYCGPLPNDGGPGGPGNGGGPPWWYVPPSLGQPPIVGQPPALGGGWPGFCAVM